MVLVTASMVTIMVMATKKGTATTMIDGIESTTKSYTARRMPMVDITGIPPIGGNGTISTSFTTITVTAMDITIDIIRTTVVTAGTTGITSPR